MRPPDHPAERAVAEVAPHHAVEVGEAVVVAGVARAVESDLEEAGGGVQVEGLDGPGDDAGGKSVAA